MSNKFFYYALPFMIINMPMINIIVYDGNKSINTYKRTYAT